MTFRAIAGMKKLLPSIVRQCVTTPAMATEPNPSTTATRDPLGLTGDSTSKIYCSPLKEAREIFPRGLPQSFITQMDCFKKACWIVRSQSYEIISQLRAESDQHSHNKFLIYGTDGCGKTMCLNQVVHWCWKAGWLVIHVPGTSFWIHSRKELRPSPHYPETYDQPQEASFWLKNFRSANAKILKDLRLSEARVWSKRERSEEGEMLVKIIELGLHKPILATDVVRVVLEELIKEKTRQSSLHDQSGNLKILLAIDEFNGFFNPCAASVNKFEKIETHQLNLVRHFKNIIPIDKFPGAVVLSLSRRKMYRYFSPTIKPTDILGEEGMKAITGYKQVEVKDFTHEEVVNFLTYYKENNWITKEPFDKVIQEVWYLSGGNPAEIYRLTSLL